MALIKCPNCKNIVSNASYCCPRCGRGFRAARVKRFLLWLCLLAAVAWAVYRYVPWAHQKVDSLFARGDARGIA